MCRHLLIRFYDEDGKSVMGGGYRRNSKSNSYRGKYREQENSHLGRPDHTGGKAPLKNPRRRFVPLDLMSFRKVTLDEMTGGRQKWIQGNHKQKTRSSKIRPGWWQWKEGMDSGGIAYRSEW